MKIYSVGIFEHPTPDTVPTHVMPIIVIRENEQWERVNYIIERPYQIKILERVGVPSASIDGLFPYPSYILHDPVEITCDTQALYLIGGRVLYARSFAEIGKVLAQSFFANFTFLHLRNTFITLARCL